MKVEFVAECLLVCCNALSFSLLSELVQGNLVSFHLRYDVEFVCDRDMQFYKNLSKGLKDIVWKADPVEGVKEK